MAKDKNVTGEEILDICSAYIDVYKRQEFKLMPIEDFIKAEGVIPQLQERVRDYVERY